MQPDALAPARHGVRESRQAIVRAGHHLPRGALVSKLPAESGW